MNQCHAAYDGIELIGVVELALVNIFWVCIGEIIIAAVQLGNRILTDLLLAAVTRELAK